jgi:hypothetical protein
MDVNDLLTVFTVAGPMKAEIIKNYLLSEGIHCFLENNNQAVGPGLNTLEIQIQVPAADADRAGRLIASHEAKHHA